MSNYEGYLASQQAQRPGQMLAALLSAPKRKLGTKYNDALLGGELEGIYYFWDDAQREAVNLNRGSLDKVYFVRLVRVQ